MEDQLSYSPAEIQDLLAMLDHANTHSGGLRMLGKAYGLLGTYLSFFTRKIIVFIHKLILSVLL